MLFKKNTRLVMAGDSVTDCGRLYEAAPGGWGSFGDGYVNLVHAFLTAMYPEQQVMVINKGLSGNTIIELEGRWEKDILASNPDWVCVMIGVNDVWRQFDGQLEQAPVVSRELFREKYETIVAKTLPNVDGMIIMSPFMIEENKENTMRKMVEAYAAIGKDIAEEHGIRYVDLQSKMDHFLESLSSYHISQDRVHPNIKGHMIIAKAFMDVIETDWAR